MENEKEQEQGQTTDDRKPYETPSLTKFGNVMEITQGPGTPPLPDVAGASL